MDSRDVAAIVESGMTVSDKIRALNDLGHTRADIARLLGKRYQHVRNVLEADKLHGVRRQPPPPSVELPHTGLREAGLQEAGRPYSNLYRLALDDQGRLALPPEVLAVLGGRSGLLVAELEADRLVILSARAAAQKAQDIVMRHSLDPSRMLSEELIAERRAEAARE